MRLKKINSFFLLLVLFVGLVPHSALAQSSLLKDIDSLEQNLLSIEKDLIFYQETIKSLQIEMIALQGNLQEGQRLTSSLLSQQDQLQKSLTAYQIKQEQLLIQYATLLKYSEELKKQREFWKVASIVIGIVAIVEGVFLISPIIDRK